MSSLTQKIVLVSLVAPLLVFAQQSNQDLSIFERVSVEVYCFWSECGESTNTNQPTYRPTENNIAVNVPVEVPVEIEEEVPVSNIEIEIEPVTPQIIYTPTETKTEVRYINTQGLTKSQVHDMIHRHEGEFANHDHGGDSAVDHTHDPSELPDDIQDILDELEDEDRDIRKLIKNSNRGDSDNQDLSFNATTGILSIQDGNTVDLSNLVVNASSTTVGTVTASTTNTGDLNATGNTNLATTTISGPTQLNGTTTISSLTLNPINTGTTTDKMLVIDPATGEVKEISGADFVAANETLTVLTDNNDGTFTYKDEDGATTIIDVVSMLSNATGTLSVASLEVTGTSTFAGPTTLNGTTTTDVIESNNIITDAITALNGYFTNLVTDTLVATTTTTVDLTATGNTNLATTTISGPTQLNGTTTISSLTLNPINTGTTTDKMLVIDPATGEVKEISAEDMVDEWETVTVLSYSTTTQQLVYTDEDGATTTTSLAGLSDSDWYVESTTNNAEDISDNIYTLGEVTIGTSSAPSTDANLSILMQDNGLDGLDIRNTSTSSSERLVQLVNNADSGVTLYIRHDNDTNPQGAIRIDGPKPEIEFVETDQAGGVGKWEIQANGGDFGINSRLANDSGFEKYLYLNGPLADGGQLVLNAQTNSATRDLFKISNSVSSAGSAPGFAWENTAGGLVTSRLSSAGGSGFTNSNFRIQVADSSKALQERLRIDVDGDVGIGTTNPINKLHINNNTGVFEVVRVENSTAGGSSIRYIDSANTPIEIGSENGDAVIRTNSTIRLIAKTGSGNVGIGTTAPTEKLDVDGEARIRTLTTGSSTIDSTVVADADGVLKKISTASVAAANEPWFGTDDDAGATDNTEDIYALGNVGIGTTDPTYKLQTAGANSDASINGVRVGKGGGDVGTNTAVGDSALASNTTGYNNSAHGSHALGLNTTGSNNTATGYATLLNNTTGINNTANGAYSLYSNTTGVGNTANGYYALYLNTTGTHNTATGYASLLSNTTGGRNTANGYYSLYENTTGDNNTANGYHSLRFNTTGTYNTGHGVGTLYSNTTGGRNTAVGGNALQFNTTGSNNAAIGYASLLNNTTGINNTANGSYSLYNNTSGANNVANGYEALRSNTTGGRNTANGYQSLRLNTTGTENTSTGYQALRSNTTGNYNTANGSYSLRANTTGERNVANGYETLSSNTTGDRNTASGMYSLRSNTIGSYNTSSGYQSLNFNTTGNSNTAHGYLSLYRNTTGVNNTAIGEGSGDNITTGSNNIVIGGGIDAVSATADNQLNIGNWIYGAGGDIGIGVAAPTEKLDVNGEARIRTLTTGSSTVDSTVVADADGVLKKVSTASVAAANEPWFGTDNNAGATDNTEDIYALGNVGIGTTSPSSQLHVVGGTPEIRLTGNSEGYINAGLVLEATESTNYRGLGVFMHDAGGDTEWYAGTPYADADQYQIGRNYGVASHNTSSSQTTHAFLTIKNDGDTIIGGTGQIGGADPKLLVQNADDALTTGDYAATELLQLSRDGTNGNKWSANAQFKLGSYSNNSDSRSSLQIALTDANNDSVYNTVMTMNGNGNVGIGTAAPSESLHILNGNQIIESSSSAYTRYVDNGATPRNFYSGINFDAAPNVYSIGNKDTDISFVAVDLNGNVGIGTTAPAAKLDIKNDTTGTEDALFRVVSGASRSLSLLQPDGSNINDPFTWVTSNAYQWRVDAIDAMTIDAVGNVGIGTTAPSSLLTVSKEVTSGTAQSMLSVVATGGTNLPGLHIDLDEDNNKVKLRATGNTTPDLAFGNLFNDRLIIKGDGKVGIGTTAPDNALDVVGTIQASNLLGGAVNLTTDANGNIIRDPSDANLKENIRDLEGSALDKILQLRGVSYEWKDKGRFGDQTEIGFVAQELQEVLPEVVRSGGEYLSVNIRNILGIVVEAIKELFIWNEEQDDRIAELEGVLEGGNNTSQSGVTELVGSTYVKSGDNSVDVTFNQEFDSTPIVMVTPHSGFFGDWWVSDKSRSGFTIKLEKQATDNYDFDWFARGTSDTSIINSNEGDTDEDNEEQNDSQESEDTTEEEEATEESTASSTESTADGEGNEENDTASSTEESVGTDTADTEETTEPVTEETTDSTDDESAIEESIEEESTESTDETEETDTNEETTEPVTEETTEETESTGEQPSEEEGTQI